MSILILILTLIVSVFSDNYIYIEANYMYSSQYYKIIYYLWSGFPSSIYFNSYSISEEESDYGNYKKENYYLMIKPKYSGGGNSITLHFSSTIYDADSMFKNCNVIRSISFNNLDMTEIKYMTNMFEASSSLEYIWFKSC